MTTRSSSPSCGAELSAAICRLQNCLLLTRDLKCEKIVDFKVYKSENTDLNHRYLIVVHVRADYVFAKYFQHASRSDMALFRGMFVSVAFSEQPCKSNRFPPIVECSIQQTFLPKFENEGQDTSVADAIETQADEKYMVVSVKHSGSLCTLSHELIGAKNSFGNPFTAAGLLLIQAHYRRVSKRSQDVEGSVRALLDALKARRLSVAFEVVARCLSDHGQRPQGEYLVCTSICHLGTDGTVEVLPWLDQLRFCQEQQLPVNDAWLFASRAAASGARAALDSAAVSGRPTAQILHDLDAVIARHSDCVKIPGTYPHDDWQGSRIEGFVVSQGGPVDVAYSDELRAVAEDLRAQVLPIATVDPASLRAAEDVLSRGRGSGGKGVRSFHTLCELSGEVAEALNTEAVPSLAKLQGGWVHANDDESSRVLEAIRSYPLDNLDNFCLKPSADHVVVSRLALARTKRDPAAPQALAAFAEGDEAILRIQREAGPESSAHHPASSAAMRAKCGPLAAAQRPRYKKKMMLYTEPGTRPRAEAEVGYCMMTFVIRNGIRQLRGAGVASYLSYVRTLVSRWDLSTAQREACARFAASWCNWLAVQGKTEQLNEDSYLDLAEEFVEAFLTGALPEMRESALYGVIVLVGFEPDFLFRLKQRTGVLQRQSPDRLAWSRLLAEGGCMLEINVWSGKAQKPNAGFWKSAAPSLFIVQRKTPQALLGANLSKDQKRLKGLLDNSIRPAREALQTWCKQSNTDLFSRLLEIEDDFYLPEALLKPHAAPDDKASEAEEKDLDGDGRSKKERKRAEAQERAQRGEAKLDAVVTDVPSVDETVGNAASADMLDTVCEWLEANKVARPARNPSAVIVFAGVPGMGKTTLSHALIAALTDRAHIKHHHSDALDKEKQKSRKYWPLAAELSVDNLGDDKPVIVVADKNLLDSPRGNWESAAKALAASGARVIAVLMTDAQSAAAYTSGGRPANDEMPFGIDFVAVAMRRVLDRTSHVGGLDSKLAEAMQVVAAFANTYTRARDIFKAADKLKSVFGNVITLPVVAASPADRPAEVAKLHQLIETGICYSFEHKDKGAFPPGWEAQVRDALDEPSVKEYLQALTLDQAVVAKRLEEHVLSVLARGSEVSPHSLATLGAPYFAVAGLDWGKLNAAFLAAQASAGAAQPLRSAKREVHVTLWHVSEGRRMTNPEDQRRHHMARDELLAAVGSPVEVQVDGFDLSAKICAARVRLMGGPEAVHQKSEFHVTTWHDSETKAFEAAKLAARAEAGDADVTFVPQTPALTMTGVIEPGGVL